MYFSRHDTVLYFGVLFSLYTRWSTSIYSYSGAGKPPLYGDYEAQRHWQEITVNLPEKEWYKNSSLNDLQYWGLDYPPLTAYHSLLCGYVAQWFDKTWVALGHSRGYESEDHKLFMRSTVLAADVAIFYTAVIVFWSIVSKPFKARNKAIATTLTLLYPGIIAIDHGHFQYNCVSLGLLLWAVIFIYLELDLIASFSFVLALNYKQMELYHAIPFFAYLMGVCVKSGVTDGIRKFLSLAFVVIATFIVCWIPFIFDKETPLLVLKRLFPVARGLYEDKVANFWCALSVVLKLRNIFSNNSLVLISAGSTLLACLPSAVDLFRKPNFSSFRFSLVNCSLAFFLFSYQVHEKSILIVAIPFLLLLDEHPVLSTWFSIVSMFSMHPLLIKDGLNIPYFALTIIFGAAAIQSYSDVWNRLRTQPLYFKLMMALSCLGMVALSVAPLVLEKPKRYPDIFTVFNAVFSCLHFLAFFIYCNWLQLCRNSESDNVFTAIKKRL